MSVTVRGVVTSGLGEGAEFVTLDGYARQFRERLGYDPYPGTLNLALDSSIEDALVPLDPIRVREWESDAGSFGAVDCYPASVVDGDDVPLHAIVPHRSDHDWCTLEVVSPVHLRERFALDDGDAFAVQVESATPDS